MIDTASYEAYWDRINKGITDFYEEWKSEDRAIPWGEWVNSYLTWLADNQDNAEFWASDVSRDQLDGWITAFEGWQDYIKYWWKAGIPSCAQPQKSSSPGFQRFLIAQAMHDCINKVDPSFKAAHKLFADYQAWCIAAKGDIGPLALQSGYVLANDDGLNQLKAIESELLKWRSTYTDKVGRKPAANYRNTDTPSWGGIPSLDFGSLEGLLLVGGLVLGVVLTVQVVQARK